MGDLLGPVSDNVGRGEGGGGGRINCIPPSATAGEIYRTPASPLSRPLALPGNQPITERHLSHK